MVTVHHFVRWNLETVRGVWGRRSPLWALGVEQRKGVGGGYAKGLGVQSDWSDWSGSGVLHYC